MTDKPKQLTLAEYEASLNLKAPAGWMFTVRERPDGHIEIRSGKRP